MICGRYPQGSGVRWVKALRACSEGKIGLGGYWDFLFGITVAECVGRRGVLGDGRLVVLAHVPL